MATLAGALFLSCLVAAAGQGVDHVDEHGQTVDKLGRAVDKFGNPCELGGTPRPKAMPVGAQVGVAMAATSAVALAGTAAAIESDPKLKAQAGQVAEGAVNSAKKAFSGPAIQEDIHQVKKAFRSIPDVKFSNPKYSHVELPTFTGKLPTFTGTLPPLPPISARGMPDLPTKFKFPDFKFKLQPAVDKVNGTIMFQEELSSSTAAEEFVRNAGIASAISNGLATQLGIPGLWVTATLTLKEYTPGLASMQMDFNIAVPLTATAAQKAPALEEKVKAVTAAEVTAWAARAVPVSAVTSISTTMTPWDSSSGSSGSQLSASLNSASLQTGDSDSSSGSSGSTASGSSGFYMWNWLWICLGACLCCCIGAVPLAMKQTKKTGSKKRSVNRKAIPEAPEQVAPVGEVAPLVPFQAGFQPASYAAPLGQMFASTAPLTTSLEPSYTGNYTSLATTPPPATTVYAQQPTPVFASLAPASRPYAALPVLAEVAPALVPSGTSTPQYATLPVVADTLAPAMQPTIIMESVQRPPQVGVATPPVPPIATGQRGSVTDALFGAIDVNNDGVITRGELRQALRANVITPGP